MGQRMGPLTNRGARIQCKVEGALIPDQGGVYEWQNAFYGTCDIQDVST